MNTVARFGPHRTIGWSVNQRWQGLCHKHTPHLAPVVECASKTIPALSDRVLGHLAKVDEHTSLCGLTTARNSLMSCICSSSPPVQKDLCLYARSVCCWQSFALLRGRTWLLACPACSVCSFTAPSQARCKGCQCFQSAFHLECSIIHIDHPMQVLLYTKDTSYLE